MDPSLQPIPVATYPRNPGIVLPSWDYPKWIPHPSGEVSTESWDGISVLGLSRCIPHGILVPCILLNLASCSTNGVLRVANLQVIMVAHLPALL